MCRYPGFVPRISFKDSHSLRGQHDDMKGNDSEQHPRMGHCLCSLSEVSWAFSKATFRAVLRAWEDPRSAYMSWFPSIHVSYMRTFVSAVWRRAVSQAAMNLQHSRSIRSSPEGQRFL